MARTSASRCRCVQDRASARTKIVAATGAGGMGEVYRARDTKLDRNVAIKILPELFANDPDHLARFKREAKTLAALNHADTVRCVR